MKNSAIYPIEMPMPGMLGTVTCYVVVNATRCAIVDTGMASEHTMRILHKRLSELGFPLGSVEVVVCTHYHPDHCGLGQSFLEAGVPVRMSQRDVEALERWQTQPDLDIYQSIFYGEHDIPEDFKETVAPVFAYFRTLQQAFHPEPILPHETVVDLAGVPFEIVRTPGHTDGHICLLQREQGVLLTGDHVLPTTGVNIALRQQSSHACPLAQYLNSLAVVSKLGAFKGFSSHGGVIPDTQARSDELGQSHLQKIAAVQNVMSEIPATAYELSSRAFGAKRRPFSRWLSMAQTVACLEYLVQEQLAYCEVSRNKRRYRLVTSSS